MSEFGPWSAIGRPSKAIGELAERELANGSTKAWHLCGESPFELGEVESLTADGPSRHRGQALRAAICAALGQIGSTASALGGRAAFEQTTRPSPMSTNGSTSSCPPSTRQSS